MSETQLRIRPILEFGETELSEVGTAFYKLFTEPVQREMIQRRRLPGVIVRHGETAQRSVEELRRARHEAATQGLATFIMSREEEPIGMISSQENLPLYRQRVPLWARFTRNRILGEEIPTNGLNVSAWVADSRSSLDDLKHAYRFVRHNAKPFYHPAEPTWTIEPVRNLLEVSAIEEAGYEAIYPPQRYDDNESGKKIPPTSQLYISHDVA